MMDDDTSDSKGNKNEIWFVGAEFGPCYAQFLSVIMALYVETTEQYSQGWIVFEFHNKN